MADSTDIAEAVTRVFRAEAGLLVGRGDPNISGRVLPYTLKTERRSAIAQALEEMADHRASAPAAVSASGQSS